jgi:uncharacterized protein YjiS (DUF1127 family)
MNTYAAQHPAIGLPARFAATLATGAAAWRSLAGRVAAWLAQRRRAADDLDALARMSERELHDIGISRGSLRAIAAGAWPRDRPHGPDSTPEHLD